MVPIWNVTAINTLSVRIASHTCPCSVDSRCRHMGRLQ